MHLFPLVWTTDAVLTRVWGMERTRGVGLEHGEEVGVSGAVALGPCKREIDDLYAIRIVVHPSLGLPSPDLPPADSHSQPSLVWLDLRHRCT